MRGRSRPHARLFLKCRQDSSWLQGSCFCSRSVKILSPILLFLIPLTFLPICTLTIKQTPPKFPLVSPQQSTFLKMNGERWLACTERLGPHPPAERDAPLFGLLSFKLSKKGSVKSKCLWKCTLCSDVNQTFPGWPLVIALLCVSFLGSKRCTFRPTRPVICGWRSSRMTSPTTLSTWKGPWPGARITSSTSQSSPCRRATPSTGTRPLPLSSPSGSSTSTSEWGPHRSKETWGQLPWAHSKLWGLQGLVSKSWAYCSQNPRLAHITPAQGCT